MENAKDKSGLVLEFSRIINVYATLVIIIIGLIGHSMTLLMYSKKRFRSNSSNIYLLCLAVIDGSFLILHFFEGLNFFIFFPFYIYIYK
jgi:hypothetical protein